MKNARQSSTRNIVYCKQKHSCDAKNAIDGDMITYSNTNHNKISWWMAEMDRAARIKKIHFSLGVYSEKTRLPSKLTVFTKLYDRDDWTVCKEEFAVNGSINPYEMKCAQERNAKYLRITTAQEYGLLLREVKVFGPSVQGSNPSIYK